MFFFRWKHEHNLTFTTFKGEAAEVDKGEPENFRRTTSWKLTSLMTFTMQMKRLCMYFHAMPGSTYVENAKKVCKKSFKTAKDWVTLRVLYNKNRNKEELLLIGKSKFPRCFRNIKNVPIPYDFSANTWMTSTIFEKWLTSWDCPPQMEKNKVVLLVNNCLAHYFTAKLNGISLRFRPPNITYILQPCDMGIVGTFKAHFRYEMRHKIIDDSENELALQTVVKRINFLDTMHIIKPAGPKFQMPQSKIVGEKEVLLPKN